MIAEAPTGGEAELTRIEEATFHFNEIRQENLRLLRLLRQTSDNSRSLTDVEINQVKQFIQKLLNIEVLLTSTTLQQECHTTISEFVARLINSGVPYNDIPSAAIATDVDPIAG